MLFNSVDFLIFLPIVLVVYYCLTRKAQNLLLLAASYLFYGWWDWRFVSLLLISTFVDYWAGLFIADSRGRRRKAFLLLSICVNLGILGFFKYFNFFVASAVDLLTQLGLEPNIPLLQIILPVGISYYTFQSMAYTIDVYREQAEPCRDPIIFALYVAYFPQLVAGPIERSQNLIHQLNSDRKVTQDQLHSGAMLMLIGFFKKLAIADAIAPMVEKAFAPDLVAGHAWPTLLAGVWLFAIQIYCDFSGYSDIARGTSRLLGIELMVNFNQPYLSTNITEFWRRWHISLSTWLRDYLYIPLGGNRHGRLNTYRNLMLTMILGGLWHGAKWTFVAWGTLHGLYLAVHKLISGERKHPRPQALPMSRFLLRLPAILITFHLVLLTWVFFRAENLTTAIHYLTGILTLRGGDAHLPSMAVQVGFVVLLVLMLDWPQYRSDDHLAMMRWPWVVRGIVMALMVLLIILRTPDGQTPFIYFQF